MNNTDKNGEQTRSIWCKRGELYPAQTVRFFAEIAIQSHSETTLRRSFHLPLFFSQTFFLESRDPVQLLAHFEYF